MTDSKTYNVRGADVIVTASVYPTKIDISITVDLIKLDDDLPSHNPHNLMSYLQLSGYVQGQTYWWCKVHRTVTVKTGSQAQRVIKHALTKIDDAIYQALQTRKARMSEIDNILP